MRVGHLIPVFAVVVVVAVVVAIIVRANVGERASKNRVRQRNVGSAGNARSKAKVVTDGKV